MTKSHLSVNLDKTYDNFLLFAFIAKATCSESIVIWDMFETISLRIYENQLHCLKSIYDADVAIFSSEDELLSEGVFGKVFWEELYKSPAGQKQLWKIVSKKERNTMGFSFLKNNFSIQEKDNFKTRLGDFSHSIIKGRLEPKIFIDSSHHVTSKIDPFDPLYTLRELVYEYILDLQLRAIQLAPHNISFENRNFKPFNNMNMSAKIEDLPNTSKKAKKSPLLAFLIILAYIIFLIFFLVY